MSETTTRRDLAQAEPPAGWRDGAMLDGRFAVAFGESVPAAMAVAMAHFTAVARRDLKGVAATLHFPFAIYEGIEADVYETREAFLEAPPRQFDFSGEAPAKGHGGLQVTAGSYDMLAGLELLTFNPINVGLALSFTRHAPWGEKLETCEGVYAVTNNDGRWAIQLCSTIFTPAFQEGVDYRDAVEAHLRHSRDWMMGWSHSDGEILASRRPSPGRHASVSGGTKVREADPVGGPMAGNFLSSARTRRPMSIYGAEGVASRLSVRRIATGEQAQSHTPQTQFDNFSNSARGGFDKYGYTLVLPNQRVLHATVDKAHTFGGYVRYTPASEIISETRSLGILTYVDQVWGAAGMLGQCLYRDRTNDARHG
ncbi:MAG TPA: hypothetical protein VGG29_06305 [Caulobacteraceae bacterium]|jgi:hypothetical protein